MRPGKSLEDKLNNYIVDANGCWIWQGTTNKGGYGLLHHKQWNTTSHRAYYITYVDKDLTLPLDHKCRVRLCMNPDHLEPVTDYENFIRGEAPAAKVVRTNKCKRGHELSPDNVYLQKGLRVCRKCQAIRDEGRSVTKACLNCGANYKANKYRANQYKYCGHRCAALARYRVRKSV
jgi:hypothetical protein